MEIKETLRNHIMPIVLTGYIGLNALANYSLGDPNTKTKMGFPLVRMTDTNLDGGPNIVESHMGMRGYYLKTSREPNSEDIRWFKSQR